MGWIDGRRFFVSALVALACMGLLAGAARATGLAELQEAAVTSRNVVKKFELAARQGDLDTRIARSPFWPSLDLSYTGRRLDEGSSSEISPGRLIIFETREASAATASVSYNLFSGFRDRYQVKSAEFAAEALRLEHQAVIEDIRLAVALRYIDVFLGKESLDVARTHEKLLEKQYGDTQKRYEVGLIQKNDLLKIGVELDNVRQRRQEADAAYEKSLNHLAFTTDREIDPEALSFEELSAVPVAGPFEELAARMLENRHEIKAVEAVQKALENAARAAKAGYYPAVDVSAGYTRFGEDLALGDPPPDKDETRVALGMRMNLFEGFRSHATVAKASLEAEKAGHDLYELKQSLSTDLKNMLLDFETGEKNLAVAKSAVVQAEENLRATDIAYRKGVQTATELLDAIFFLSRAKLNEISARIRLFSNHYQLMRMVGSTRGAP